MSQNIHLFSQFFIPHPLSKHIYKTLSSLITPSLLHIANPNAWQKPKPKPGRLVL
jgi:hypothetical protein